MPVIHTETITPERPLHGDEAYQVIELTRGQWAKVSPEDFEFLSQFNWFCTGGNQRRAVRMVKRQMVYMHHVVVDRMGLVVPAGFERDHQDRDTLNNTRSNLRVVTHTENMKNTARHDNHKGVMLHVASGNWFAYLNYPKKVVSLGYWKTKEKAEEVVALAKMIQPNCPTKEDFLREWESIKPRKAYQKAGM